MAKESAMVQIESKITCGLRFNSLDGHCWFPVAPFVCRCNLCNPPVLPCPGKAKLGEDHPDTLNSINNLAAVLEAQEAEPLYREALEKSPGAQLQRFQRDFGQWIWSHFRWLISGFGFTACFLQVSHDRNWCSVIFCLSNFEFPIVFLQNKTLDDIGKFGDAFSCFHLNVFLFKSIS